jgi:hypothetical protein
MTLIYMSANEIQSSSGTQWHTTVEFKKEKLNALASETESLVFGGKASESRFRLKFLVHRAQRTIGSHCCTTTL